MCNQYYPKALYYMLSDLYKLQQHLKFLKDIQIDYSTRVLPFITSIAYINNINEDVNEDESKSFAYFYYINYPYLFSNNLCWDGNVYQCDYG